MSLLAFGGCALILLGLAIAATGTGYHAGTAAMWVVALAALAATWWVHRGPRT